MTSFPAYLIAEGLYLEVSIAMATHIQFSSLGDEVLDDLALPVVRSVVQGVPTVGQLCVHIEPRLREGRGGDI